MKIVDSKSNPCLFGHEDKEAMFLKMFNSQKIPHSIILSGQKGIGKETFAYRIARFLFAYQNGWVADTYTLELPSDNPVFEKMALGGFPDLNIIERVPDVKTGKIPNVIKVEQVRDILTKFQTTSAENGWRVVIVNELELMNKNACNAILKFLEEPPVRTLLLLVCNNIDLILDTIKSRCRLFSFKNLSDEVVLEIVKAVKPKYEEATVKEALYFNTGSAGKTLEFLENGGYEVFTSFKSVILALKYNDKSSLLAFSSMVSKKENVELFKSLYSQLLFDLIRFGKSLVFDLELSDGVDIEAVFEIKNKYEKRFQMINSVNLEPQSIVVGAMLEVLNVCR